MCKLQGMAKRNETGKDGESVARAFLEKQGYRITHTNWHWHHYELDIVAVKDTWLIVVEVKTRSEDYLLAPEEAVDAPKTPPYRGASRCVCPLFQSRTAGSFRHYNRNQKRGGV